MTNAEKFKTVKERYLAFRKTFGNKCEDCQCQTSCSHDLSECIIRWLDMEAEDEKPLPCPFCGGRCVSVDGSMFKPDKHGVRPYSYVSCTSCGYSSIMTDDYDKSGIEDIVAAHNRVARAVMAAKKSEVK